tara:strand:+ start:257 stop:466 length:210 start_codon:yes stop_codon:yes gene_type:complete
MIKWLLDSFNNWNEVEKENLRAGIINVLHPLQGMYTYIDKEQFKKYLEQKQKENDRKETLSRDNKKSKS